MTFLPIAIFWICAAVGVFARREFLLYLFFISMSFGSFAVIPPTMTGGLTFTPVPMTLVVIIIKGCLTRDAIARIMRLMTSPRGLLLLSLFWVVALLTTVFMPRIFSGLVEIIAVRGGAVSRPDLLQPTTQNISQLAYLTISVAAVPVFAEMFRDRNLIQHALKALVVGSGVAVFTGILDFASQYMPLDPLLEPFRTATYALLTDVEIFNGKRVVGLMPEASSYGALTTSLLAATYFFRRAISDAKWRDKIVPVIMALLLVFAWLSTSSGAYVALIIFFISAGAEWVWRMVFATSNPLMRRGLGVELVLLGVGIFGITALLFIQPTLLDPIVEMFDRIVLQKTQSSSFEERSMWTAVSWQALMDTYGLGVGVGSTRPSNEFVAVISSTGILGALLYYSFVVQSLMRRALVSDEIGGAILNAVRWSYFPSLVVGLLSGTSADIGPLGVFRFGIAAAVGAVLLARHRVVHPRTVNRSSRRRSSGRSAGQRRSEETEKPPS